MATAGPNVNFFAEGLDHFVDRVMVVSFGSQFLLWVVGWGCRWSTRSAVHTALRNARVQCFDETRIVKAITRWLRAPEQRIPLSLRWDGKLILAVVLICTRVCKVLVVSFVLVNVVEIVWEICILSGWWATIEWSTPNALKCFQLKISPGKIDIVSYWKSRQRWTADSFDLVTSPSTRCRRKNSLRVVLHGNRTSAHHHLVGIWRASFPAGRWVATAKTAELLWRTLFRSWNWFGTWRDRGIAKLVEDLIYWEYSL